MKLKSWLFSLLLSLTLASDLSGAIYYVGTAGSDANSCATAQSSTAANRKRNLAGVNGAIRCLTVAGDVLVVGNGTYNEDWVAATDTPASGTSVSVLTTIKAENPGLAIWKPLAQIQVIPEQFVTNTKIDYIKLQDLIIDGGSMTDPLASMVYISNSTGINPNALITGWVFDSLTLQNSSLNSMQWINTTRNFILRNSTFKDAGRLHTDASYPPGYYTGVYAQGSGHLMQNNSCSQVARVGSTGDSCLRIAPNATGVAGPGNNIIEKNFGVASTTSRGACIVIGGGANNTVRNNICVGYTADGVITFNAEGKQVIYNNTIKGTNDYCLSVNSGADNSEVINNICDGPAGGLFGVDNNGATNLTVKNNILRSYSTLTQIEPASGGTWAAGSPSGTITTNPLFKNTGANDFNLLAGSPCIDAGINVGLPYNGPAPDCGALEAPIYGSSSATGGTNTIAVFMVNNPGVVAAVGMRNCTAGDFALVVDGTSRTTSSCTVVGNNQLNLVFSGATVTTSATVAYTAGTLSDSFCIGPTPGSASCKNGEVRTFAAQTVTVGGSTTVYTQTRGRFHLITGAENSPTLWNCAENQNCTIQVGGSERIRLKSKIDTATPPSIGLSLWANENSGAYFLVADTFGANNIKMYGTFGDIGVTSGQATTIQLTVDAANAIAGSVLRTSQATPAIIGCTIPCEREEEFAVTINTGVLSRVFCFQLRKDDGTVLDTYTNTPCMTAVNSRVTKALGGLSQGGGLGQ